jgi:hypothetical protein
VALICIRVTPVCRIGDALSTEAGLEGRPHDLSNWERQQSSTPGAFEFWIDPPRMSANHFLFFRLLTQVTSLNGINAQATPVAMRSYGRMDKFLSA